MLSNKCFIQWCDDCPTPDDCSCCCHGCNCSIAEGDENV